MLCQNCQTELPDQAVACWKCGTPVAASAPPAEKSQPDVLMAFVTFISTMALFACVGWSIPFMVWGTISSTAKIHPEMADTLGILGGIAFVASAIAFVAIVWWVSYWVVTRLLAKPSVA